MNEVSGPAISYHTSGCKFVTENGKCTHGYYRRRIWHPLYWLGFFLAVCSQVRPHWVPDDLEWHPPTCPLRQPRGGGGD